MSRFFGSSKSGSFDPDSNPKRREAMQGDTVRSDTPMSVRATPNSQSNRLSDLINLQHCHEHVGALLCFLSGQSDSLPVELAKKPAARELRVEYSQSRDKREEFWLDVINSHRGVAHFCQAASAELAKLVDDFTPIKNHTTDSVTSLFRDNIVSILSEQNEGEFLATIIAALTTAIRTERLDQRGGSTSVLFGYRLGKFLIEVGAAKVAQILNSYDETSPAWEAGLAVGKDQVNPLSSEEFAKVVYPKLPPHLRLAWDSGAIELGESVGTGTYLDTRKVFISEEYRSTRPEYKHLSKDTDFVLQIVKPNAADRAKRVYDLLLSILDKLPDGSRIANVDKAALRVLISDYNESLAEEVDLPGAMEKNRIAVTMAKSFALTIEDNFSIIKGAFGSKFKAQVAFSAAEALEVWDGGRIAVEMKGHHFKDLPDTTPAQKRNKLFCAIAIFMFNLHYLNSGKWYDKDRHSAQQKIQIDVDKSRGLVQIQINNVDELGICRPPTPKQKEIFADMLMDAIGCAVYRGIDFDETIKEAFCSLCNRQSNRTTHVGTMLKTLVTSSDVQKYIERYTTNLLVNGWIYEEMIGALAAAGPDQTIANRIKERFEAILLLLEPKKAKSPAQKALLEAERARVETHYPIKESRANNLDAMVRLRKSIKIAFQPSTFIGFAKRLASGKPPRYSINRPH
jgi:hypothetical protein